MLDGASVDANPGRVISSVLQPPQPINEEAQNRCPVSGDLKIVVAENATHEGLLESRGTEEKRIRSLLLALEGLQHIGRDSNNSEPSAQDHKIGLELLLGCLLVRPPA